MPEVYKEVGGKVWSHRVIDAAGQRGAANVGRITIDGSGTIDQQTNPLRSHGCEAMLGSHP